MEWYWRFLEDSPSPYYRHQGISCHCQERIWGIIMFPCNDTIKIGYIRGELETRGCPNVSWTFQKGSLPFCLTATYVPMIIGLISSRCSHNITIFPVDYFPQLYENLEAEFLDTFLSHLVIPGIDVANFSLLLSAPFLRHKPVIFIGPKALVSTSGKGCSKYYIAMALFETK